MAVADTSRFSIGKVASTTFAEIGRNLVPFVVLTLIAAVPQTILATYIGRFAAANGQPTSDTFASGDFWLSFMAIELVTIVFTFVLQAALTYSTVMDLNGRPAPIGTALMTGLKAFLPLFAIGILAALGIGFGFVLLVVPGLMLLVAWIVIVPVYIVEKTGILGAFGRSAALTKGHRWAIFGLIVIFYIGVILIDLFTRPLFGLSVLASTMRFPVGYLVFSTLVRMITLIVSSTGSAVLYYELRTGKEGVGPQQLASVFE